MSSRVFYQSRNPLNTTKGIIFEISKEKIWKGKTALRISRLLSILEDNYGSIIDENFKTALV